MQSSSYWKKRAAKRMCEYQKLADNVSDEVAKSYIQATNYINNEIEKIFRTFQFDGELTVGEARQLLDNLPDKISFNDLESVIANISNPNKRQVLLSILSSPAYAFRIKRFEQLQKSIDSQMPKLASVEEALTKNHYITLVDEAFNRTVFDIQKGVGTAFQFAQLPVSRINEILKNNWSGKLFSERIWGKTEKINTELKKELLTGFLTGRSYNKTAKEIEAIMSVGAMEARRLVRTESTYIANAAEMESYKECDIDKYRFMATLDMRTSEICASLDGKEFEVEEAAAGVNMPPMHPWCRSTTIAVIDGIVSGNLSRRARNPDTGETYKILQNMSYDDWKETLDAKYGEGYTEIRRKMALNRTKDSKQYQKYLSILGEDRMPKSLDLFQEMKYNNVREWSMFKDYADFIKSGELTPLADFDLYKSISDEIDRVLVGTTTFNGIKIMGKSKHFIARTIGSVEQRRNGISTADALSVITNPLKIDPVRKNTNGDSQRFIGDIAAVTINPNTGMLIQLNPLHKKKGA